MKLRLQKGGAYTSDIRSLRAQIRANGTRSNLQIVTIEHPNANNNGTKETVNFHIHLAYQANSNQNFKGSNASLYTIAFGRKNNIWHFKIPGSNGINPPGKSKPINLDGSYKSLGYVNQLPTITDSNLAGAVSAVYKYNGGPPQSIASELARLIIAVNESIRMPQIEGGVYSVLGNQQSYTPSWDAVHNWGGNTLGS